jgi:hypothetical protein
MLIYERQALAAGYSIVERRKTVLQGSGSVGGNDGQLLNLRSIEGWGRGGRGNGIFPYLD